MTLTQQAIVAMLQRDCLNLAHELANKCDYEPAGMMLRLSTTLGDIDTDEGLVVHAHSMINEALADSNFTWAKDRIRRFKETLDYGVENMRRVAA